MEKTIDFNALGQAFDTSWGRSSTPKTASYSVKFSLVGDRVIASYAAIVNFGTEFEMAQMKRRYDEESINVINEALKLVKANYKSMSGKTVLFKNTSTNDSLEITSVNFHNPKRSAYYRRKTVFEVS